MYLVSRIRRDFVFLVSVESNRERKPEQLSFQKGFWLYFTEFFSLWIDSVSASLEHFTFFSLFLPAQHFSVPVWCFTLIKASSLVEFSNSLVKVALEVTAQRKSIHKTWIMRRPQLEGMSLIFSHPSLSVCVCVNQFLAYKYNTFRGFGITRKARRRHGGIGVTMCVRNILPIQVH